MPSTLEPGTRRPFVIFLHGLTGSGKRFRDAIGADRFARDKRFVFAAPDGAKDSKRRRFWNASRACCDFEHHDPDQVTELAGLVARARSLPMVDPSRVYVIGYSNGGFMAHRAGCSVPGVSAIVSIGGAAPTDGDAPCNPAQPVAMLEIHGDLDAAVHFQGGKVLDMGQLVAHPSAMETLTEWAVIDGCGPGPSEVRRLDLIPGLPGPETSVLGYEGCRAPVELWRVQGGDHSVGAARPSLDAAWEFLESVHGIP